MPSFGNNVHKDPYRYLIKFKKPNTLAKMMEMVKQYTLTEDEEEESSNRKDKNKHKNNDDNCNPSQSVTIRSLP